jgi:tetratricopeptide (TPR) repeat protein
MARRSDPARPRPVPRAPGPWPAGLVLALAALLAGCTSDALTASDREADDTARVDYYESAALTYYDGGRYETAVQMWQKVLAIEPDSRRAQWGIAKALQMLGTIEALRHAEAYLLPIVDYDWPLADGQGTRRHDVMSTLAQVYSDLADHYDRAIRSLEEQLRTDPDVDRTIYRQQVQRQIAMRNSLLHKAIPLWTKVIEISPNHPYAIAGLAKSHLILREDEKGIRYARWYVRVSRDSQAGWRRKLEEWEKEMGRETTREQRQHFVQKVLGAREKEKKMHLLLGSVHMRREEFDDAVAAYEAVIEIDPAVPAAYAERAQAFAAQGRHERAIQDLEEYLRITDPERQREGRVRAAELLDTYRRILGRPGLLGREAAGAAPATGTAKPQPSGG